MDIKCFGIARDIVDGDSLTISFINAMNVADLRMKILDSYPEFGKIKGYMVAINLEYANDNRVILAQDEIAIIPPVSGG